MATDWSTVGANEAKKKKNEDQGVLPGLLGKALHLGSAGLVDEETAKANARGVTDFVSPGTLFPAIAGAARDTVRAVPTMAAVAGGADAEQMNNSPLSFMLDTENVRKQTALANSGNEGFTGFADKFNAALGSALPVAQQIQMGMAHTGLRGGAIAGSGLSQATGNKKSIDEASDILNVESYGQAAEHGGAGAMLLGDLMNVAPALKGAAGGGSLNPLAGTRAAQAVSRAGAVAERAPLAPVYIPGRGIMEASKRSMLGHTAFPRLAESSVPGAGILSRGAESAANWTGTKGAGFMARAEQITNEAAENAKPDFVVDRAALKANMEQAVAAGKTEVAQGFLDQINAMDNAASKVAEEATLRNLASKTEAMSAEYGPGGKTVATDIYGRVIDEQANPSLVASHQHKQAGLPSINREALAADYVSPTGVKLSEMAEAPSSGTAEAIAQFEQGQRSFATTQKGQAPKQMQGQGDLLFGTEAGALELPQLKALTPAERAVIREVPENFTEKSIHGHLKGLSTPDAPVSPEAALALKGWDKGMTAWKTGVLPFRPAWHTSNAVGNAMGAMLMGEVSPTWFAQNAKTIMKELDEGIDAGLAPSMGRGIGTEAVRDLGEVSTKNVRTLAREGKPVEALKKAAEGSYKKAQSVDDLSHYVVAKNRLEKNLASGMSREAAYADANAFSLKTMGDFGNMSTMERSFLRRVMPFYPWYKHTAKASLRFPLENPGRFLQSQAWAQRLAGPQEELPGGEFLKNQIDLGGGRMLRPGGDIGLGIENNPILDPTAMGGGLAPPIQAALAGMGLNAARGRELSTAPGQSKGSAVTGYMLNNLSPITKLGADTADWARGEGNVARGDTRAPIVTGGRPVASKQGLGIGPAGLLPFFTGSQVDTPDVKAMTKRNKTTTKADKTKEKSYQKAVKKTPKK